jgi:Rrf2 family protein
MKLTAPEEYGLRCILQIARHGPSGAVTIAELAQGEALTPAYVAKLLRILRKANLVESIRGQKGGYQLARSADQISVSDVLIALGGHLYSDDFCHQHSGNDRRCVHLGNCSIRPVLSGVEKLLHDVLAQCKLSDLACSEQAMVRWVEGHVERPEAELADAIGRRRMQS